MELTFAAIDNFYPDPHQVRKLALDLNYPPQPEPRNFPGRNSETRLLFKGLDEMVSRIVSEPLVGNLEAPHGHTRVALAEDDLDHRYTVHVDSNAYWSGILYLTLPEDCAGGTELFRHRDLNSDRAPIFEPEFSKLGYNSAFDAAVDIVDRDTKNSDKWELITSFPMRFNRLVLFRSWLWHAPGISFGDKMENGRLTHMFFFNRRNEAAAPARS